MTDHHADVRAVLERDDPPPDPQDDAFDPLILTSPNGRQVKLGADDTGRLTVEDVRA